MIFIFQSNLTVKCCEVIPFLVLCRAGSQTAVSYPAGDAFIAQRPGLSCSRESCTANAPSTHFPASTLCRRSRSTLFIDALIKSQFFTLGHQSHCIDSFLRFLFSKMSLFSPVRGAWIVCEASCVLCILCFTQERRSYRFEHDMNE